MADMSLSMRIGAVVDGSLDRALGGINRDLTRLDNTTARLTARQQRLGGVLSGSLDAGNADLVRMRRNYRRITRQIEETRRAQERLNRSIERGRRIGELQSNAGGNFASSTAHLAAFALPVGAVVNEAIKFESAMAEVNKTVDFSTGNSIGKLGDELKELSLRIPIAGKELAAITAAGGQLGVADTDLLSFTETVGKMGVAFDMSAEDAGDAMAKLAIGLQIPIMEIDRIGDMINTISNNSPAKASEIVTAMQRAGSAMKKASFSEQFSVSLTGGLIAQGRDASTSSSAIESMITTFSVLDRATGRQKDGFEALGTSSSEFAQRFKDNGQEATEWFFEAVAQMPTELQGGVVSSIIGRNYGGDILALASNTELLANNMDLLGNNADGSAKYLGSMQAEFDAISATTANSVQLFKNHFNVLAITIGDALLPALNETMTAITPMIVSFTAWAKENPELIVTTIKLVGGLLLAKAAFWGISFAVLSIARPIARLVTTFNRLRAGLTVLRGMALLGAGFSAPLLLTFGLIAAAALLIYTYWKPIKAFFVGVFAGIADGLAPIKTLFTQVTEPLRTALAPLKPLIEPLIGTFSMLGTQLTFSSETMIKVKAVGMAFGYAIGTVLKYLIMVVPAFATAIVMGFRAVGGAIGTAFGFVAVQGGRLISWFGRMWSRLKAFASSGVGNILRTIARFSPLGLFIRLWGVVKPYFYRLWNRLKIKVISGIRAFRNVITNFKPLTLFRNAFSAVYDFFTGLGSKFAGFGRSIIQGLIDGVTAKFGVLKDKMSSIASDIAGVFSGKLEINSPSKLFKRIAHSIPEGIALGVSSKASMALGAVNDLSTRIGGSKIDAPQVSDMMAKRLSQTEYSNKVLGSQSLTSGMAAGSITFSPTINVNISKDNGDVAGQVQQGLSASYSEFERMFEQVEANRTRRAFA